MDYSTLVDQARQQVKIFSVVQYLSLIPPLLIAILSQIPDLLVISPGLRTGLPWIMAVIALIDFAIMRFLLSRAKKRLIILESK